jgi:hypothetical protein
MNGPFSAYNPYRGTVTVGNHLLDRVAYNYAKNHGYGVTYLNLIGNYFSVDKPLEIDVRNLRTISMPRFENIASQLRASDKKVLNRLANELDRVMRDIANEIIDEIKSGVANPNYVAPDAKVESLKLRTVTRSTKTRRGIKESVGGTVTLKGMNTDIIPVVDFGCYGGILSYALDDVFVYDCIELDAFDPDSEYYDDVVELVNDKYDGREEFYAQVLSYAPSTIQDAFNEYEIAATVVPNSCKWDNPQFYNYRDDSIEFDMTVDTGWVESKFREFSNNSAFRKCLKDNFSSRDGFISFMPDSVDEYNELLDPNNKEYWKVVSALVHFIVSEDPSIREDITSELEEYVSSNGDYVHCSWYEIY